MVVVVVPVLVLLVMMVELECAIFLTIMARSSSDKSDDTDEEDGDEDEEVVLASPTHVPPVADMSRLPPRLTGVWLWVLLLFMRRTSPSTRSSTCNNGRRGW